MAQINLEDLIGKKFGKLTILEAWRNEKSQIIVQVQCECGNIKECLYVSIKTGKTTSCGKHNQINLQNLIGQKYNRLTILEATRACRGKDKYPQIYVKAQCECGNIIECRLSALKNNTIQSCGCLHKERTSQANSIIDLKQIIGEKYGKLTIIGTKRINNELYVDTECECGNHKTIRYRVLKKHQNASCGCQTIKSHTKINLEDLIGEKYGKLTIKSAERNSYSEIYVDAECECGNLVHTRYRNLTKGDTKTCGKCQQINLEELIGQKYGKLTITSAERNDGRITVQAQCECGNIKNYLYSSLKSGHTKSCGCLVKTADGDAHKRLYKIWKKMHDRCYNENNIRYKDWGGRGITICPEWRDSFKAFETWALENGYEDNLSIDRIDNDGNYEPNNCRWATLEEQANNKSSNIFITMNDETKTLTQWARQYKIKPSVISYRIKILKWDSEKAITTPVKKQEKFIANINKRLRNIWRQMQKRCTDSTFYTYDRYGGRGITVCPEWANSFEAFKTWALENGYANELTIDRINNDGNYEPNNCRWITTKAQNNNRSNNIIITMNDKTQSLAAWCEELNLNYSKIYARIKTLNYDPVEALTLG